MHIENVGKGSLRVVRYSTLEEIEVNKTALRLCKVT